MVYNIDMKFRYRFGKTVYVLFALVYVLAAACLIWNVVRLVEAGKESFQLTTFNYISIGLCIVLPVAAAAVVTAALIDSHYLLKDGFLVVRFGVLTEKMPIDEVVSVVKNVRYGRLTVVFKDESTFRIVIAEDKFDDFSSALIKFNKSVSYGETSDEDNK